MIDHVYYKYTFHGNMIPPEEFPACAERAADYVEYATLGRAGRDSTDENVKKAICAIAEKCYLIAEADTQALDGGSITSETVGPHTIHYESGSTAAATAKKEMYEIAQRYLWRYMYRGVPCVY